MKKLLGIVAAATLFATAAAVAQSATFGTSTSLHAPGVDVEHGTAAGVQKDGNTLSGGFGSATKVRVPGVDIGHGTQGGVSIPMIGGKKLF
jgi:hypothetical protein